MRFGLGASETDCKPSETTSCIIRRVSGKACMEASADVLDGQGYAGACSFSADTAYRFHFRDNFIAKEKH